MLLFVLHILWTFLFLRILFRILTKSAADASRNEYEGDSDDEVDDAAKTD